MTLTAFAVAALALLAFAPAAVAAKSVDRFVGGPFGTGEGEFNAPRGVAVNENGVGGAAPGDVYVVELGGRVQVLDADGKFKRMWGGGVRTGASAGEICTSAQTPCQAGQAGTKEGQFNEPEDIAIDQDTGNVYVSDRRNRRIQQFDALGSFIRAWGFGVATGANAFEICTANCLIGLGGAGVGQVGDVVAFANGVMGLTVSTADGNPATGKVYLADSQNRRVNTYNLDGTSPASFGSSATFGTQQPRRIAVDSRGIVYASDSNGSAEVDRYDSLGVNGPVGFLSSIAGTALGAGGAEATVDLEVDPDSDGIGIDEDALYVLRDPTAGNTTIMQFGPVNDPGLAVAPGAADEVHMATEFGAAAASGLGIDALAGDLYVAASIGSPPAGQGVYYLDEDGTGHSPTATLMPATDVESDSAAINGSVDPDGGLASYRFEYSIDGVDWTALPEAVVDGAGPVSASLSDLQANTFYRYRLLVKKVLGPENIITQDSAELSFITDSAPPVAATSTVAARTDTSATLAAEINPNGSPTTYRFEWGETSGYGNQIPVPAASAGSAGTPSFVTEELTGLSPASTYHYRVVAQSPQGTAIGSDVQFTTRPVPASEPERAWEMVTAPIKPVRSIAKGSGDAREGSNSNPGLPSLDGESLVWGIPSFPLNNEAVTPAGGDRTIFHRTANGWVSKTLLTQPYLPDRRYDAASLSILGLAGNHAAQAIVTTGGTRPGLLPNEGSTALAIYTRRDGTGVNGYTGWLRNVDTQAVQTGAQQATNGKALFNDDGSWMARWGEYRGIVDNPATPAPEDPSFTQQIFSATGGSTLYRQGNPPSGEIDLVNECSGTVGGGSDPDEVPTGLPERVGTGAATDTIGQQSCEAGDNFAATGTGTRSNGSTTISGLSTASGAFEVGQFISGEGIPAGTKITAVGAGTLTLSANASSLLASGTASYNKSSAVVQNVHTFTGAFAVGQTITGTGIPVGTTIIAVDEGARTLTLSANPTAANAVSVPISVTGPPASTALIADTQSVTSIRGAALGGGSLGIVGSNNDLKGPAATAMSNDGRRLFFASPDPGASGVPTACAASTGANTSCPPQLFVRQYDSEGNPMVRWISRSRSVGVGANGYTGPMIAGQQIGELGRGAAFEGASRTGEVVYFRTNAPLTPDDPNGGQPITTGSASDSSWDLYRFELPGSLDDDPDGGVLTRISGGPTGTADPNAGQASGGTARFISDDGSRAYFITHAPLVGGDAAPPQGGITGPGAGNNLYLFDDTKSGSDRYRYIANLGDGCAVFPPLTGPTHQMTGSTNQEGNGSCVRGVADGQAISFLTASQLSADDTDDVVDLYFYDARSDELTRISTPHPGALPFMLCRDGTTACGTDQSEFRYHAIFGSTSTVGEESDDLMRGWGGGRLFNMAKDEQGNISVFFGSRTRLLPGDTNGNYWDVYRWREGQLSLISSGDSADHSYYSGNGIDGRNVFIFTSKRLDPREVDDADFDLYTSRVGGGFPYTPPATPCDVLAFGCEVNATPAPPSSAPASVTPRDGGNVTKQPGRRPRCAKSKVRKQGRCVSKKRAHGQKQRANSNRRTSR